MTEAAEQLLQSYKDIPIQLVTGKFGGTGGAFTDEQKQFALSLHYYSPATYEFLRKHIQSLPSQRTIRSWLTVVDGQPGLQKQVYESIKNCINSPQGWMYKLCVLHMDEMEIKKNK